jgi:hypothetical protein
MNRWRIPHSYWLQRPCTELLRAACDRFHNLDRETGGRDGWEAFALVKRPRRTIGDQP